ncbi:hypothetical protein KY285_007587 [Solanum tuberosum]|nr:hypothetical protein KY285_007587 [Solanum tuberosum]
MKNQKVLNGRVFDPDILTAFGMSNLFDAISLQGWGHLFEPPTPYLHEPEVCEFYYNMELLDDGGIRTIINDIKIFLDEESLGIILGVLVNGIQSIEDCKPSSEFLKQATKRGDIKRVGLPNKFLKGEYQLLFEFINKVLVPQTEKKTITSAADMFLMEKLDELEEINLPALMLNICTGAFGKRRTWEGHGKEVEIAQLKSKLQKVVSKGPGTSGVDEQVVQQLRDENELLLKSNASLSKEVKALNKQIIQAHEAANERMSLLMRTLNPLPPPS